jgi:hypothetical protein
VHEYTEICKRRVNLNTNQKRCHSVEEQGDRSIKFFAPLPKLIFFSPTILQNLFPVGLVVKAMYRIEPHTLGNFFEGVRLKPYTHGHTRGCMSMYSFTLLLRTLLTLPAHSYMRVSRSLAHFCLCSTQGVSWSYPGRSSYPFCPTIAG